MKKWTIYRISSPSGKVYVGVTSNFKKRMSYYRTGLAKTQPCLGASFMKYGLLNHKFDVIEEFSSNLNYALGKEMFWIRSYMSNICKFPQYGGLNLTDGGDGTIGYKASDEHRKRLGEMHKANPSRGMLGKHLSEETKQKLREFNKKNKPQGRSKYTEEQRLAASKARKGKPNYAGRGRKMSNEAKLKMSLAKKGKPAHNKGKPMPLHQIELLRKINTGRPSWNKGKNYDHLTEEERKEKFGKHNKGNTFNKGRKQAPEVIAARVLAMTGKPNSKNNQPVVYEDLVASTTKEYPSLKDAHKELGIPLWAIGDSLAGRFRKPKPYVFKYKEI